MDLTGLSWHETLVFAAVVLGPLGCLVSLGYALRVDRRDNWRRPMLLTVLLGAAAVLGAYWSGDRLLADQPELAGDPQVTAHQDYALKLVLPTVGWFVIAMITGWVNPRTGALKLMLPLLLSGFAVVVLVLLVLAGDADARSVWHNIAERF